jgi:hypothetical protein
MPPSEHSDKANTNSNDFKLELSIHLNRKEFWFLLQQFSPAIILGMENPHLGWLTDEIKTEQRNALKSLMERDLVQKISKDEIELDDVMATMLGICANPEHSLVVQFQNGSDKNIQSYVHFKNSLIVEQFEFKPGQYRLTAIKEQETLIAHLTDFLRLSTLAVSRSGNFRLPEDTLFEARSLCAGGHTRKAIINLKKVGVSEEKAIALASALSKPLANSTFVVLSNRNNTDIQHVKGFALLESESEIWIMLPYDKNKEKMVEFIPANPKLIRQHFLEILP